jgi:predicted nuclease of predicted toxin-antitoxin system
MRILIDACLPVQFKDHLSLPGVQTAREMGWQRLKNGALLARAEGRFDVLITMDKSIPSQQVLSQYSIALLIVRARSNRLPDLLPLVPHMVSALRHLAPGTATVIS